MLKTLKELVIKTKKTNLLVCTECWEPDHPQLQLGMYPVEDPQAVRNPRVDNTYVQSGVDVLGFPSGGSRDIQWGWSPVGGSSGIDAVLTPNNLVSAALLGTVTVTTT